MLDLRVIGRWAAGCALFCVSAASVAQNGVTVDVVCTLKPGVDAPFAARHLAVGYGAVKSVNGTQVTIRLGSSKNLVAKATAIGERKSVASLNVCEPQLPQTELLSSPVDVLERTIESYKLAYQEYESWYESTGRELESEEGEEADEVPGLDYLEAYLQWKRNRAYPNKQIDQRGYKALFDARLSAGSTVGGERGRQGGPETVQANWQFLGPTNLSVPYRIYYGQTPCNGRVNAVAIDPTNPSIYYIGGSVGGVWKSTDAGVNWAPLGDAWPSMGVSSLAIHPTNPSLVLAGTGDFFGSDIGGIGVMRSTNGGTTWTRVGTNIGGAAVADIEFDPDNPNIVYAAAGRTGTGDVYRSADGGATWVATSVPNGTWSNISISTLPSGGPRTIYAVGASGTFTYKSTDQGVTWTAFTVAGLAAGQNPLAIAASKVDASTAYLLSTTGRKVYKTIDSGATWSDVTAGFPNGTGGTSTYNWSQGWYDYHITTSYNPTNNNDVVYVGLIDVVVSVNGGTTWRNTGGSNYTATYTGTAITHNDQHCFTIDPSNPNTSLVGNDGGAYRLVYNPANDTMSWTRLSANLGISQFYTLAIHPTNANYLTGGTQDNATPHSFGNLASWGNPGAGDGAGCAINQFNTNFQYNSSQYHGLEKTTNAWSSSSGFAPAFGTDRVPFIGGMWIDPNNGRYVYVNTEYLWRYDEDVDTWTARVGGQRLSTSSRINWVAVAPGDSNKIYTGSGDGELWVSSDFGATWRQIDRKGQSGGLPNASISSISIDPNNKNDILVGYYGSSSRIYRCTDTTATTPAYVAVNGVAGSQVPNVALTAIERDPWFPADTWYAATDAGVFMTRNGGTNWTDITQSRGLPNTQVTSLAANKTTGYLTAATFGRGMWRIKLVPANVVSASLPASVLSGDSGVGTVTIDRVAPTGGVTVNLLSSDTGKLQVPATMTVPAGQTTGNFNFTTSEVTSDVNVQVSASIDTTVNAVTAILKADDLQVTRYSLRSATAVSGALSSLGASDDSRLVYQLEPGHGFEATVHPIFRALYPSGTLMRIEVEFQTSVAGLTYRVLMYDYVAKNYVQVGSGVTTTSDQTVKFDLTSNLGRFMVNDPVMAVVVNDPGGANGNYQVRVDRSRLRTRP